MASPSATNQQPWEFCVVKDRDLLEQIGKVTPYATPAAQSADCAIATENIWLEREELGLGGVMLGIAPFQDRMNELAQILKLPPTLMPFTIFALGYPKKKSPQKDRFNEARIHFY